jgi:CRP-like cAMP-binding protein
MSMRGLFVNAKEIRRFEAGDLVFTEGSVGTEMFGVVSGRIELRHADQPVAHVVSEGTFGELGLIDHAPRSLTAVAVEPSEVAVIDEPTFLYLVHETPTFALQVMRAMSARIRQLSE